MSTTLRRVVVLILIVIAAYVAREEQGGGSFGTDDDARSEAAAARRPTTTSTPGTPSTTPGSRVPAGPSGDIELIRTSFADMRSDVQVEICGPVDRTLRDDDEGSRHQRFIVRLDDDLTVLIAHNIDLAPRVPLDRGDLVCIYGEYEWNPQGGVIHWTHHDPQRRRAGGWIDHEGKRYE